jgi:hypothetical protein
VPFLDFIRDSFDKVRDWLKGVGKAVKKATEDPSGLDYHHWTGTYKPPNYDGHQDGVLPKELKCGESFVIYIAEPTWEDSCVGFGGAGDGDNANCVAALKKANAAAAQVTCPTECPKQVTEIWRGWKCDKSAGDKRNWAICAVELEVTCAVTA